MNYDDYQLRKDIDKLTQRVNELDLTKINEEGVATETYVQEELSRLQITGDSSSDGDLQAYVKKTDVVLLFELGDNGIITIGIDVGDGF